MTSNKGGPRKQTSALTKKNTLKLVTHASPTQTSEPTTHAPVTHVYDPTTQTYVEQDCRVSKNTTYEHSRAHIMIEYSRYRILFIPKKKKVNIDKTLKRKRKWLSQLNSVMRVDYEMGRY